MKASRQHAKQSHESTKQAVAPITEGELIRVDRSLADFKRQYDSDLASIIANISAFRCAYDEEVAKRKDAINAHADWMHRAQTLLDKHVARLDAYGNTLSTISNWRQKLLKEDEERTNATEQLKREEAASYLEKAKAFVKESSVIAGGISVRIGDSTVDLVPTILQMENGRPVTADKVQKALVALLRAEKEANS